MREHDLEEAEVSTKDGGRTSLRRTVSRRDFLRDSATVAIGLTSLGRLSTQFAFPKLRAWAAATPQSIKDTIVVGWEAEESTLDPSKARGAHELRFGLNVFETMWRLEGGSPQIKPSLGTQWRVSEDGKEWTFTVRSDARFHDGTPLRAQDIQWANDRWMDPNHPFYDPPYGSIEFFLRGLEKVRAIDDRTVRFYLKRPDAAFDSNLVLPYSGAVSPTAFKKLGKEQFALKPVGTGPWKVVEWRKGTRLILERNSAHWDTPPILRRMIIKPIPEDAVRLAQLKTGEADAVVALPPQFIPEVESDPNLRLLRTVGNHIWFIALNMRQKPLADKRVRQALNYAVNKEAVVNELLKGGAKVAAGPMMAGSWAEDGTLRPYSYDPRKAKQLLAAAGYGDGLRLRFWVPESGSGMIAPKEIATMVQAQLREVGVAVEIVTQEWTTYTAQYGNDGLAPKGRPAFDMGEMSMLTPLGDPAQHLENVLATSSQAPKGYNPGSYSNPEVDQLLAQAGSINDRSQRKSLYVKIQRIIYDDAPWIFMFSAENLIGVRKNIRGLEANPCPWWLDFTRTYVGE